jgi:hypothetical protein
MTNLLAQWLHTLIHISEFIGMKDAQLQCMSKIQFEFIYLIGNDEEP